MKRCVPIVIEDGTAEDGDQAVAVCASIWKRAKEGKMDIEYSSPVEILEFKADGDEWSVDGYPSTFNNVDRVLDRVMPGAFKDTLKSDIDVAFLLAHDPRSILGVPRKLKEDDKGLFGSMKISKTQLGADTRQLLLDKAIRSFSIGYRAVDWKMVDGDVRELYKVDLYEVSLVSTPANPKASVTGVKDYKTMAEHLSGISAEVAELLNDLRVLSVKDRPLSEKKRAEIQSLLEKFSELDAVHAELVELLEEPKKRGGPVSQKMVAHKLAELRKKYGQTTPA
jgi:HK97 family phage prohead protease